MNSHRKMTPKGQMSTSGMGPAITHLPLHLKTLFEPNPPLEHKPQLTKRKMPPYTGISQFFDNFEKTAPPPRTIEETPQEKSERIRKEKEAQRDQKLQDELQKWDPQADTEKKSVDAYKTLFVGRISYQTTEQQLRQEFESYGAVKSIRLVVDQEGKSRGYAFVEFEHESDLKAAFKLADGKKIDGRRVVVDVERGRTVKDWKPRKLGGGIGDTRKGGNDVNVKYSGREPVGEVRIGGGSRGGEDRYRPRDRRERSRDRSRPRERRDRKRSRSRSLERSRDHGRSGRDRDRSRDRRTRDRDRNVRHRAR